MFGLSTELITKGKLRMMIILESDAGILGKKEIRVLLSGVEPKTFRLLVRMLCH